MWWFELDATQSQIFEYLVPQLVVLFAGGGALLEEVCHRRPALSFQASSHSQFTLSGIGLWIKM